LSRILLLE
jgi:hypothetical protein